jgi:hypothetical protein
MFCFSWAARLSFLLGLFFLGLARSFLVGHLRFFLVLAGLFFFGFEEAAQPFL